MRLHSEIDVTVWCAKCRKRLTEDLNLTKCEEIGHPAIYVKPHDCQPEPCNRCATLESENSNLKANLRHVRSERDAARADIEFVCNPDDSTKPLELADIVPGWYVIRDDDTNGYPAGVAAVSVEQFKDGDLRMWRAGASMALPLDQKGVTFIRRLVLEDAPKPEPAEVPIRVGQVWEGKSGTTRHEVVGVRGDRLALWTVGGTGSAWSATIDVLRDKCRLVREPAA